MTCIVGWMDEGKVWMGGDSAGVANYSILTRADEKVFINGSFIFGFTTSFRMGQLLRFSFSPPPQKVDQDDYTFMCTDFINAIRKCLKAGGFAKVKNDVESGGNFLVGYKGQLYEIEGDYQVGKSYTSYNAVGCGFDIAKGACYVLKDINIPVKDKITTALNAAVESSAGVRPPFTILSL